MNVRSVLNTFNRCFLMFGVGSVKYVQLEPENGDDHVLHLTIYDNLLWIKNKFNRKHQWVNDIFHLI